MPGLRARKLALEEKSQLLEDEWLDYVALWTQAPESVRYLEKSSRVVLAIALKKPRWRPARGKASHKA